VEIRANTEGPRFVPEVPRKIQFVECGGEQSWKLGRPVDPDGDELGEVAVKLYRLFGKGVHWSNEQSSLKYNGIGTVIGNLEIHAVDTHKYPLKSFFKMQFETVNGC
jgi:hypothetical protein